MNTQQKPGMRDQDISPHLRQRVAFIAALIPDPRSANWEAIEDTWDELSRETRGTPHERKLQSLQDPIKRQDANALAQRISLLLGDG